MSEAHARAWKEKLTGEGIKPEDTQKIITKLGLNKESKTQTPPGTLSSENDRDACTIPKDLEVKCTEAGLDLTETQKVKLAFGVKPRKDVEKTISG